MKHKYDVFPIANKVQRAKQRDYLKWLGNLIFLSSIQQKLIEYQRYLAPGYSVSNFKGDQSISSRANRLFKAIR